MKQKLRKASQFYSVGIAYTADQVLLCVLRNINGEVTWCLDTSFSHQSWQSDLKDYVHNNGLVGTDCYFTLSSHWYRIYQIDKPMVEDSDVFSALQWPLKEASGSEKDIVYDFVDLPAQVSGQNKILAVAVAREEIEKLTEVIFEADLNLKGVSIEEIATNQLVKCNSEPVITLVQEHGEVIVLNIVKDNQLYFTRRLKGFENIGGFTQAELEMGITDSLSVQIQRSMDFFESQLRQAPIRRILVKLDSPHTEFLCQHIADSMGVSCEMFIPELHCSPELNFKIASFSCLGAAYSKVLFESEAKNASKSIKSKKETKNKKGVENEVAN
ncbi:biogenesis protein MshI [Glaciecola petra]|uniref:Biogenesis protein MshI n=1 Tax=Glaciecola petra TaxID=3075602 RepID=A0ABU2ZSS7_9ALTE|nr:biogenesis protein MshI [Aestuariibacter sp. P117]MDT0595660.1 biogenesis protein MshI [Aestuariibacter sp. P117]